MSKEILIVKNITREGPGILEDLLKERGIQYSIVDLSIGQSFPSPKNYGAVVVLGGPDSANDENDKMQQELARIRETVAMGVPYLGICLGLQTLVKAEGGSVVKNAVKEIGFRDQENNPFTVEVIEKGKQDPLLMGLGQVLNVFHLHGETVELTSAMELLASGKFCKNQIVKVGQNAYGIQCHFELTPEMFEVWINEDQDLLKLSQKQLKNDFDLLKEEYSKTGRWLFENFLKIAGF